MRLLGISVDFEIELEHIMLGFIIMIAIMIISSIILASAKRKENATNNAQPIRKELATVVDKEQIPPGVIVVGNPWVLFERKNGSRVRLRVPVSRNDFVIGDTGMLSWQGERLIGFNRTAAWVQTTQMPQQQQSAPVQQNIQAAPTTSNVNTKPVAEYVGNAVVVHVEPGQETVRCPKCSRIQASKRNCCWDCGVEFFKQ